MKEEWRNEGVEWFKALSLGIIVFVAIRTFFFSNYVVEGESMLPTLEDGNKVVVNKIGFEANDLQRFDVIVFHANEQEDYVKRIIGLPGDTINYRDDQLYINGEQIDEPFLEKYRSKLFGGVLTGDFTLEEVTGKVTIPEGYIFVLGDNRRGSWDSRHFGLIAVEQIVGKVNLRYWPLDEMDVSF
ncbi:signal peptidase I [Mesobacillus maritimus]|uniref:signal peptidase I n=1 Tax=Mesobacillus maritimus TaxID=1643336 RepID=UPI00203BA3C2|nr:signal peptidase I [Mesobacillus maritimus]MCM3586092.1 signal peptidase I [Mesobacillus maritimus]MCM3667419.1 signal peptidase I [Mesobacillus maritimus]